MKTAFRPRILVCWLILLGLLVALHPACARNPVTGKREIALISEAQEAQIGREAHPQILAQYGQLENREIQSYVNDLGQRLARVSHRPELEWHFTVVDVPVVNAFALPGGYIYITREIMAYMNNEAELVGVLGHEIGHVTARHSVSQMSRAQLFGLGLGIGSIISPTFYQLSGLAETGLSLLFLKHGRDDERQSDSLAVGYMLENGYDPRAFAQFFEVFQMMQEESGQALPHWLSTHPTPPDRIERTSQEAEQALAQRETGNLKVERDGYLRRLQGMVYGENPREGFMQDGTFLHPDLRFQISFPRGWRVQNTRNAVLAAEPNGGAGIQLTLAQEQQRSPEDYAAQLARQPGFRLVSGQRTTINGNPSFIGVFEVTDQERQQSIAALAAFISFRGNLYQIAGITSPNQFQSVNRTFEQSLRSFSELRDSRALQVQPDRLRIESARQGQTLADLARSLNNPRITAEDLARLNRLEPNSSLRAGAPVKVVEPGRR
jgi:predicted Zn-dependent protease